MRSGGNNYNYFPESKLTKLANFLQFIRMLMFCLEDWGACTLGYADRVLIRFATLMRVYVTEVN